MVIRIVLVLLIAIGTVGGAYASQDTDKFLFFIDLQGEPTFAQLPPNFETLDRSEFPFKDGNSSPFTVVVIGRDSAELRVSTGQVLKKWTVVQPDTKPGESYMVVWTGEVSNDMIRLFTAYRDANFSGKQRITTCYKKYQPIEVCISETAQLSSGR